MEGRKFQISLTRKPRNSGKATISTEKRVRIVVPVA
jgi:hypothetical protein